MSPLLNGYAETSTDVPQSEKVEAMHGSREQRRRGYDKANEGTITMEAEGNRKVDKRSFDYVLRTGLAGGLAGCAVSNIAIFPPKRKSMRHVANALLF